MREVGGLPKKAPARGQPMLGGCQRDKQGTQEVTPTC